MTPLKTRSEEKVDTIKDEVRGEATLTHRETARPVRWGLGPRVIRSFVRCPDLISEAKLDLTVGTVTGKTRQRRQSPDTQNMSENQSPEACC